MRNALFLLFIVTMLVTAITLAYKSLSPYLPEGTRVHLERDGGVFSSRDGGNIWAQDVNVEKGDSNFSRADVFDITFPPGDSRIVYAATSDGLFVRDGTKNTWQGIIIGRPVYALAINPNDRRTVFIASRNDSGLAEIARSTGEVFSFSPVFAATLPGEKIIDITIDFFNNKVIFALTSLGRLLESDDGGEAWRTAYSFPAMEFSGFVMDPSDSRILYAYAAGALFISNDKGLNWTELTASLDAYATAKNINGLAVPKGNSSVLYLATDYGILRSKDRGKSWSGVPFLLPFAAEPINAITLYEKDPRVIYTAAGSQIYQSTDEGKNWKVRALPSVRVIHVVAPDPENKDIIFVGVKGL